MSYPSDIFLPSNAKYYGFTDQKLSFNTDWDVTWSFEYALSGTEHGICTFLSNTSPITGIPGQYLGYNGTINLSSYIATEDGEYLLTENGERIIVDSENGYDYNGMFAIAFDTTGLFALSSDSTPGVGLGSIVKNSLIIRDDVNNVVVNAPLTSISTDFVWFSAGKYYQTLRFRFSNAAKVIHIDYKPIYATYYTLLTSVQLNIDSNLYPETYVGFSFCSPVSSLTSPSTLFLKNFHVQGDGSDSTVETSTFIPITSTAFSTYTILSGVTANPIT